MNFDPNNLYYLLAKKIHDWSKLGNRKKLILLAEGGTRSSKTWDIIHLIYTLLDHNKSRKIPLSTYVIRNKLTDCRDYTYDEFEKVFKTIGVNSLVQAKQSPKPEMQVLNNTIRFRGLDKTETEAYPSDILYFNELIEASKNDFDALTQRNTWLTIGDWNPRYTRHWVYDLEKRDNVFLFKTNYKNNKHLRKEVVNEIESWNPDIEENVKQGTADQYRWEVYGKGRRASREDAVFKDINWIDKFPALPYWYGVDFGWTKHPTAVVKFSSDRNNVYIELLVYEPTINSKMLIDILNHNNIDKTTEMICESADRYSNDDGSVFMVRDLQNIGGFNAVKVSKAGGLLYMIDKLSSKRINIVKNKLYEFALTEVENYLYQKVNGISQNKPIDAHDHMWSAAFYANSITEDIKTNFSIKY